MLALGAMAQSADDIAGTEAEFQFAVLDVLDNCLRCRERALAGGAVDPPRTTF